MAFLTPFKQLLGRILEPLAGSHFVTKLHKKLLSIFAGLMKLSNTGTGLSEDSCSSSGVLDSDGLPAHHNEVQRRLAAIFANHESEVQHLRRDLYLTRIALCRKDGASATARNQTQNGDATTPGKQCLWSGGRRQSQTSIMYCIVVERVQTMA